MSGRVIVIAIETVIVCSLSFTVDLAKIGVGADLPRKSDRVMKGLVIGHFATSSHHHQSCQLSAFFTGVDFLKLELLEKHKNNAKLY